MVINDNEIKRKGLMFVLSSPSGAGKTSLSRKLLELDKELFLSISYTTRPPRPGEIDGEDYFFVNNDDFADMQEQNEFLEYAKVFDYYYGTPKKPVKKILDKGRDILFDIDWQGTQQLMNNSKDDLVKVFVLPPSIEELERRLKERNQDDDEIIQDDDHDDELLEPLPDINVGDLIEYDAMQLPNLIASSLGGTSLGALEDLSFVGSLEKAVPEGPHGLGVDLLVP